jgi:Lysylphosphatidylglycerol synthase TM region
MDTASGGAGRRLSRRGWLVPAAGAAGVALLVYVVARLDPANILAQLQGLWSILPVILLITAAKYPFQAAGWRFVLPPDVRPPWGASISATISGDALGYLTWAGPFTGEPLRALLVRDAVPVARGTAAGAIERGMFNAVAALLVCVVLFALVSTAHTAAFVTFAVASGIALALMIRRVWRRNFLRPPVHDSAPAHDPRHAPEARPVRGAAAFLGAARDLWQQRRSMLPVLAVLCLAQHALLVAEAYIILSALSGGTTIWIALVFEAVTKIVNAVGTIVPGRLGVAEGGSAVLADALGFAASYGLSLALMRRIRALIWSAVGLTLLPISAARLRRLS